MTLLLGIQHTGEKKKGGGEKEKNGDRGKSTSGVCLLRPEREKKKRTRAKIKAVRNPRDL